MNHELLGLAFAAGLVAALNPCGFAMLPGYLALVVRSDVDDEQRGVLNALGRAVAATGAMALGFIAVFGTFALLTVTAASTVQRYLPYLTIVIGLVLVALGIWLLIGRDLAVLTPTLHGRWAPTARLGSMFGYGLSYALASLSCTVGPFLAATGVAFQGGAHLGFLVYVAYAAGFTLVVGALAIAAALASSAVAERMRRILPYVNRISGVLLVVIGLYVSYYGLYEVRLFMAGGDPSDPVIAAAGRLQGALAGWTHQHGAWPWVAALVVLACLALIVAWRSRPTAASRRLHGGPATAADES